MRTYIAIACLLMGEKRRLELVCEVLCWIAVGTTCISARAHAHPAAAESPTFSDPPCIVVADKREQEHIDIDYAVLMDDTVIESGDIPVSDAKTHQFFALTGTIWTVGVDDLYVPYSDLEGRGIVFPLWVTHDDVQRSAAAVALATGVTAEQTDLPPERVLETRPDLDGNWLRITADDARRPITATQALVPVRWKLADVPAGVYTVTGYVFSPPYNAWAARPGVVKIVDADHNPAAGAIKSLNEVVFAYQGRRVQGCVDVPSETRLDAYYFLEEKPEMGWIPWIQDQAVQTGELEQCFHLERSDVAGSIRLRWDLRPPDGPVTTLRSKDTFTWLQGSGTCVESASHCCAFAGSGDATGAGVDAGGGAAVDAGSGTFRDAGGGGPGAADSGGACGVVAVRAVERGRGWWILLGVIWGVGTRRSRRRQ